MNNMCDDGDDGCVVRVRGLPWSASNEEVHNFFEGLIFCQVCPLLFTHRLLQHFHVLAHVVLLLITEGCDIVGGKDGVHFTFVRDGRPSGEAYIELTSEEDVEKALARDKDHMGKRYIEGIHIFFSRSLCCLSQSD